VAAVVAVLLLLPHAVAADERDELDKTRRRLGAIEAVLRDARADAGAVADALAAADLAVAVARARLAATSRELEVARRRRAAAVTALEAATDEAGRRPAWPGRSAAPT
jgi:septal ring factor EnvC (AmiA/AmiB activator)